MSTEPSGTQAVSGDQPRGRKPFLQQGFGDMVRSLVLLGAGIVLIYGCTQLLESEPQAQVRAIDYSSDLHAARELAPYDVLAPRDLPDQWRATSADVERSGDVVGWHLGFLDPDDKYVGLEQTNGELEPSVADIVEGLPTTATVTIGDRRWQVLSGAGRDQALVNVSGSVTTMVVGSAALADLKEFAAALD